MTRSDDQFVYPARSGALPRKILLQTQYLRSYEAVFGPHLAVD